MMTLSFYSRLHETTIKNRDLYSAGQKIWNVKKREMEDKEREMELKLLG